MSVSKVISNGLNDKFNLRQQAQGPDRRWKVLPNTDGLDFSIGSCIIQLLLQVKECYCQEATP